MDVVRPPVQKNHGPAVARACFGIYDVENAGIDALDGTERAIPGHFSRRGGLRDGAHALFRNPAPATGLATAWSDSKNTTVTACGCENLTRYQPWIAHVLAAALLVVERT